MYLLRILVNHNHTLLLECIQSYVGYGKPDPYNATTDATGQKFQIHTHISALLDGGKLVCVCVSVCGALFSRVL